jgi:general secretion pathway protein F
LPIYLYKGYDIASGAARKGSVEADSPKTARQRLRSKDKVIVSELKEEIAMSKDKAGKSKSRGSVSLSDLCVMTRQFATLQAASVPLDESLRALTEQVENVVLRNTLAAVKDAVTEGRSLGDACGQFPNIFDKLYVNMVKAGESSGNLGLVLERLADFQEYQVKVRGQIFSALAYPLIMIIASLCIIAFLFISVVPKLQKVFANLKVALPWYTQTLIAISEFLQSRWYIVVIGSAVLYYGFKTWYRTDAGKEKVDTLSLRVPIFGAIILRVNVSKFTKTLSTLLGSGVPIITALEITRNVISNRPISDAVKAAKQQVQEGESLAATIEKSNRFPPLVVHMIRTGEKTGELEQMLKHVSNAYDAEVERKIDSLISMIEPLMIIVMGGVVAIVVIAMLVPMLSIMSKVR